MARISHKRRSRTDTAKHAKLIFVTSPLLVRGLREQPLGGVLIRQRARASHTSVTTCYMAVRIQLVRGAMLFRFFSFLFPLFSLFNFFALNECEERGEGGGGSTLHTSGRAQPKLPVTPRITSEHRLSQLFGSKSNMSGRIRKLRTHRTRERGDGGMHIQI